MSNGINIVSYRKGVCVHNGGYEEIHNNLVQDGASVEQRDWEASSRIQETLIVARVIELRRSKSGLIFRAQALDIVMGGMTKIGLFPTVEKLCQMPPEKRRAFRPARWMTGPIPRSLRIENREIEGQGGQISLRIYKPQGETAESPLVLYLHGGGWVGGGLGSVHHLCAQLAVDSGVTFASVDYRLAPECPYPAGLNDSYDALLWVSRNAAELGCDTSRIAVMGDSAGGNLAAALCLLVREKEAPKVSFQALIYPSLDATLESHSMSHGRGRLRRREVEFLFRHYLAGADPRDPLVSPLLATDLSDLPPAVIITADVDVLRDDGSRYAARLAESGVRVRYTNYLGMPHGFLSVPRVCPSAQQARSEVIQELSRFLDVPMASEAPN